MVKNDSSSMALAPKKEAELFKKDSIEDSLAGSHWEYGLNINFWLKLAIAIVFDSIDFIVGIVGSIFGLPGLSLVGTGWDIAIQLPVSYILGGKYGGITGGAEVLSATDIGNILDAFFPAVTIAVVMAELNNPNQLEFYPTKVSPESIGDNVHSENACRQVPTMGA